MSTDSRHTSRTTPPLPIAAGLRDSWRAGYDLVRLRGDLMAGLTVGIVAIPLAMALAIASGVPPQHGLYTAIVAGALIALTGGSRFNISGPTAAFVVILFPVVQQYGLGGLLLATLMAGLILVALGLARLGTLIRYIPYPVVLGFTAGIAVVIAVLQLPDFLGLSTGPPEAHFIDNLSAIVVSLPGIDGTELLVGASTLLVLLLWPRLRTPIPAPLMGLACGALLAWLINHFAGSGSVETIASRFSWSLDGQQGQGIPPAAPEFQLPWRLPGADGDAMGIDFALLRNLLGPAFAIAMLAAIESLLCSVVADGMTGTRHEPNAELVGQGIGNIVTPFFGGITATAAIARTASNIRSGAFSPLAAVVHALVVLLAVISLAGVLGLVPMASLAALLFVIAWNMSEAHLFRRTLRSAPTGDVAVLLTCFGLTVLFDMVIAVAVGVGLASALFIRDMALLTRGSQVDATQTMTEPLPREIALYDINGPMFFGAAEKAIASLHTVDPGIRILIIDMQDVPSIDATATTALSSMLADLQRRGIRVIFCGLPPHLLALLRRAGLRTLRGQLTYCRNAATARAVALRWLSKTQ